MKLLELMAVCTIVATLLLAATPAMRQLYSQQQQQRVISQLIKGVQVARMLAVSEQQRVLLCGSSDRRHCDGAWQKSQIILALHTQQVLAQFKALSDEYQVVWRATLADNTGVRVNAQGFLDGQQGSFFITRHGDSHVVARLIINRAGRIRVVGQ